MKARRPRRSSSRGVGAGATGAAPSPLEAAIDALAAQVAAPVPTPSFFWADGRWVMRDRAAFERDLAQVLNRYSVDALLNTPDIDLASNLVSSLLETLPSQV